MYLFSPDLSSELSLSNCLLDISTRMNNKSKSELLIFPHHYPTLLLSFVISVNGNIIFLLAQDKHSESSLTLLFFSHSTSYLYWNQIGSVYKIHAEFNHFSLTLFHSNPGFYPHLPGLLQGSPKQFMFSPLPYSFCSTERLKWVFHS